MSIPENLLFATEHVIRVREVATKAHDDMASLDEAYAEIHRDHPVPLAAGLRGGGPRPH